MAAHVDADKLHFRMLERRLRTRDEIGQPRPHADDKVGFTDDFTCRRRTGYTMPAEQEGGPTPDGASSGKGLANRDPAPLSKILQLIPGFCIMDASACNDDRAPRCF